MLIRKSLIFTFSLWLAGLTAWAAPSGFIVRVEGDRIVINRGLMDSVKVGDRFTVLRQGRTIAELQVQNVNQQDSQAIISQRFGQEPILPGDALSLNAPPDPTVAAVPGAPVPAKATTPLQLSMEQTRQDYQELLSSRSQKKEFSQKWSGKMGMTKEWDSSQTGLLLDSLGFALWSGGSYSWWGPVDLLVKSGQQMLVSRHMHDRMMRDYAARIEIEVVRWDTDLLDSYCKMSAAQQGMASQEEYSALRNQMIREKSLDVNDVFQVRIKNTGELNVEMAPFHWHMFLSGPENKKVVSSRYDQVLDRKLTPNQEVLGFIYFPKFPGREDLKVFLVDVYGDEGEFSF